VGRSHLDVFVNCECAGVGDRRTWTWGRSSFQGTATWTRCL
jgi:hypothetical protein